MSKSILYEDRSGSLQTIAVNDAAKHDHEIEVEFIHRVAKSSVPKYAQGSWVCLPDSKLPTNRKHREAWYFDRDNNSVEIDKDKERQLCLQGIRELRDRTIEQTDVLVLVSLECGTPLNEDITTYRQLLRDLPEILSKEDFDDVSDMRFHALRLMAKWEDRYGKDKS